MRKVYSFSRESIQKFQINGLKVSKERKENVKDLL